MGVEGGFEARNRVQTLLRVGQRWHERLFAVADRLPVREDAGEVGAVLGGLLGIGQQNRMAGKAGFDGVPGRAGLPLDGTRPGGELRVGVIGGETGVSGAVSGGRESVAKSDHREIGP